MNLDEVPGWFPESNRRVLAGLIKKHDVRTVLEIGSFLGLSAIWFAQRVEKVTCIDPWEETATEANGNNLVETLRRMGTPKDFYHVFLHNIQEFQVADKIIPIRATSESTPLMYPGFLTGFDLVYIDGDHSPKGITSDLVIYGEIAQKVLCGDDYADRPEFGVVPAVNNYVPKHELRVEFPFWWWEKIR